VYAEPLPVNEILVPPPKADRRRLVAAQRQIAALFAKHAGKPYVIKFSSWNTLFCDIITEAFPSTPWVISVRDPLEVAVSLLRERPGWLRSPGDAADPFADRIDPARTARSIDQYVARLLAADCDSVARLDPARGRMVDYEMLPYAVWTTIAPHFGLAVDPYVQQRMTHASHMNSKAPLGNVTQFTPDDAAKRAAASSALRSAIDAIARPSFEALRRLHASAARV
jgi:hypothetical protein